MSFKNGKNTEFSIHGEDVFNGIDEVSMLKLAKALPICTGIPFLGIKRLGHEAGNSPLSGIKIRNVYTRQCRRKYFTVQY